MDIEFAACMKNIGVGDALNVNLLGRSNTLGITIKKWGQTFGRDGPNENVYVQLDSFRLAYI